MTRFMSRNFTVSALAGAALSALAAAAGAQAATINVTTSLQRNHDQVVAYFKLFHDPVNKANNGITLIYKGGPEAIPNRKQGAALKRGVIDFVFGPSTYYAGEVPETRVVTLSNRPQQELRRNGAMDLLQVAWAKGLNAHIVAHPFYGGSTFHVYLRHAPKISEKTGLDLTGVKLRATPAYVPFMKAMGATTISISPSEVYTALQRGVVDGLAWPEGGVAVYGWQEFIKYMVGPGFWRSSSMAVINLDKYKSMTKKERDALDAAGIEFEKKSGPYLRKLADIDNAKVFKAGVKPMDLTGKAGAAFTRTVYQATWEAAKKYRLAVSYDKLKRLLLAD